jgi:flagellar biosynthesis protein FlhA
MKRKSVNTGFIMPSVDIRGDLHLRSFEYRILIKGNKAGGGKLSERLLAIGSGSKTGVINGILTAEPIYNFPAVWIRPEDRKLAEICGYTVVDNVTIIATHVVKTIDRHTRDLLEDENCKSFLSN